ncbi:MAG: hypothetical protein ABI273_02470 [Lacunisphaera sp.]
MNENPRPSLQESDRGAGLWSRLGPLDAEAGRSRSLDLRRAMVGGLNLLPMGIPQFVRTQFDPSQLLRDLPRDGVSIAIGLLPDGSWRAGLKHIPPGAHQ